MSDAGAMIEIHPPMMEGTLDRRPLERTTRGAFCMSTDDARPSRGRTHAGRLRVARGGPPQAARPLAPALVPHRHSGHPSDKWNGHGRRPCESGTFGGMPHRKTTYGTRPAARAPRQRLRRGRRAAAPPSGLPAPPHALTALHSTATLGITVHGPSELERRSCPRVTDGGKSSSLGRG